MPFIFVFILFGLAWHIQGEQLDIYSKFNDGDVIFTWNNVSSTYHVFNRNTTGNKLIRGYNKTINSTEYTVRKALLYDSIYIKVNVPGKDDFYNITYEVTKVKSLIGKAVNVSWTASYFPKSGIYDVYHSKKNKKIFQIRSNGENMSLTKYIYNTRPYSSENISFEITNITMDDAGYYNGGEHLTAAGSGGGVVLIVKGKPSKPDIIGDRNVEENEYVELTCFSQSTSAPDYYSKLLTLSYTWFVNDTKINITSRTLILNVTKDLKYNRYSCTATEKDLTSDKSDGVRINPLYGPDGITFDTLQTDTVIGKECAKVGPYRCIVDCNPSCEITWKRTHLSGQIDVISNKSHLPRQQLKKDMTSLICEVKWNYQTPIQKTIRLDVQS
ncbi:uncharacterized protein LOC128174891 [Crassostrea angulata]|uniref:uncharacterized protein LOC128174891 n=1 Tax=Magallana angulata TaxID=2784310 RepID=UPI0022B0DDCC|nr:uncharacterized protein LOC128174891 [Crassostrea angulata]